MIALGIDTSTRAGYLSLVRDEDLLIEDTISAELNHSGNLLPTVHSALRKAGLSRTDLDCVGVGTGPGSLTGVRVGIAFAKGLVFALGKPLVGIRSLEAIAYRRVGYAGVISVVVDAKMRGFYHVAYRWNGNRIEEVSPLSIYDREELPQRVPPASLVLSPDAEGLVPDLAARLPRDCKVETAPVFPSAEYVARQAIHKVRSGLFDPGEMVEPIYLRPGVASPPRRRQ